MAEERVFEVLYDDLSDVLRLRREDGSVIKVMDLQSVSVNLFGPWHYDFIASNHGVPTNDGQVTVNVDLNGPIPVDSIWISRKNRDNEDITNFLNLVKLDDVITIQDRDNAAAYEKLKVNNVPPKPSPLFVGFGVQTLVHSPVPISGNPALLVITHHSS